MAIWMKMVTVDQVNQRGRGTMVEHLGIEFIEIGPDFIKARMPVDARTRQPIGLLHGGASAALAETLASTAANLVVNSDSQFCVGLEINANHVRACKQGFVTGTTRPLHLGQTTQVWQTEIRDGERLVCVSRMTLAVLKRTMPDA